ncbi:MAG: XRE family transcriptional regulator [Bacteroidia bacterium]|nr:MAG: XRE family transcriptional regulator [Bacteroidia bacterium]
MNKTMKTQTTENLRIGKKIKQLRELKNYSQEYMAKELRMSVPGYGRIERNEVDVSIERAHQIAGVLGISITELISFDEKYVFNNYAQVTNGAVYAEFHQDEKTALTELVDYLKKQLEEKDMLIRELVLGKK